MIDAGTCRLESGSRCGRCWASLGKRNAATDIFPLCFSNTEKGKQLSRVFFNGVGPIHWLHIPARRLRGIYLLISGYAGGYAGATRICVGNRK